VYGRDLFDGPAWKKKGLLTSMGVANKRRGACESDETTNKAAYTAGKCKSRLVDEAFEQESPETGVA